MFASHDLVLYVHGLVERSRRSPENTLHYVAKDLGTFENTKHHNMIK